MFIGHKREIADALSGPALNTRRLSRVTQGLCDAAGYAVIVRKFDGSAIIFRPFTPAQRLKAAPARPPEGRRCLSAKDMAQA